MNETVVCRKGKCASFFWWGFEWYGGEFDSLADSYRVYVMLARLLTQILCMYPLLVHASPSGSVSWLPVVWCKEMLRTLSCHEISWSSALSSKALQSAAYFKKFVWGIVKLLINIGCPLSPLIYYVPILFVFMIKDTAIKRTFNKLCEKSQISQQNMLYCFQERPEYFLSEYGKKVIHTLSSFLHLCPLVCHL